MSDSRDHKIEIVAESRTESRDPSPWRLPAKWRIEFRGKSNVRLSFKAAIACDGHLELIEGVTPYDKEFTASRVIALFEPTHGGRLSVIAHSDVSGTYTTQCSSEREGAGRIVFDGTIAPYQAGDL